MSNSFRHKRDFRQSRTDVVVHGSGNECVGGTWVNGACVGGTVSLIWARFNDHAPAYPCRYLPNGWGGKPWLNPDIGTLALAVAVAEAIGDRAWGALGQLIWHTDMIPLGADRPLEIEEGDLVSITDAIEGQDHDTYPVLEVNPVGGSVGHPVYEIVVGERAPDFVDMITQMTSQVRIQEWFAAGGSGAGDLTLGPGGTPGAPKDVNITRAPSHGQRNVIAPQFNDTVGVTLYGTVQDRDPVNPVDPDLYEHVFKVTSPPTTGTPRPEPGLWASHDGNAHPYTVDFGYLSADGTYGTHLDYPMRMRRLSLKGTGTVTLQQEGVDVAGPYTVSASWSNQAIDVPYAAGDDLHVVVTGTSGTGVSVKCKEQVD